MAEMSKEKRDLLAMYKAEIAAAKQQLQIDNRHETWRRLKDMYGKNRESATANRHEIDVPIGFANGNVIRSALTVRNPKFTVTSRVEQNHQKAMLCEQVVNYEWQHRSHQDEVRAAVNDLIIFGHCWLKAGYRVTPFDAGDLNVEFPAAPPGVKYNYAEFAKPNFNSSFDELVKKSRGPLTQMVVADDFNYIPSREELARQVREEGGIILEDRSTLERVSPFDMLVDPSATSLSRAQWVAQRVPVRIDQAQKRKDWKAAAREELGEGQKSLVDRPDGLAPDNNGGLEGPNAEGKGQRIKWAIVWEFYDLTEGTWCVFADDSAEHFLRDPEQMPYHFGHPFIFRNNFNVPDEFYGIGELERIESLQIELNVARTDLINDRKRFRQKWMVNRKYVSQEDGKQGLFSVLTSDEDNLIALVDPKNNEPLDGIVRPLVPSQVDPQLYNVSATVISDINEVTGVTDYQRGGGALAAQTATEASIINDGAQSRMREKQSIVESLMKEAAKRLLQLTQQFMSRERTLRIGLGTSEGMRMRRGIEAQGGALPAELEELYVPYTAEDIRGAFDLMIEPGSSTAFNETQRRRSVNEMMAGIGAMAQGFPQILEMVDVEKLIEYYLRYGFSIPNASQFIKAPAQEQPLPGGVQAQLPGINSAMGGIQQPNGGVPDRNVAAPANYGG